MSCEGCGKTRKITETYPYDHMQLCWLCSIRIRVPMWVVRIIDKLDGGHYHVKK